MAKKKAGRSKGSGYVFLPKGSRIFRARWKIDGKVYTQTTGKSVKREAEEVLETLIHPFQLKTQEERETALLTKVQGTKAEIEAWKDAQPATGIRQAFQEYRKSVTRPNAAGEKTLDHYESQFDRLAKWLAANHAEVLELRQVTDEIAEQFAADLKGKLSPNSVNKHLTLFRSIWTALAKSARLTGNPWMQIRKMELTTHTRRELTIEELSRVCSSLTGEMRLLFCIGIYSGLRLGDAALLQWSAVDLVRGIIQLVPHKTAKHAHGKPVVIPIHPTLGAMLEETPAKSRVGDVVKEIAATFRRDPAAVSKEIQRTFEANGIKTNGDKHVGGRASVEVGFHSLRHTYVSLSANAGIPLALVQSIVGHSSPAMTRHYFHESLDALKGAVAALPDIAQAAPALVAPAEATTPPADTTDAAEGRWRTFCEIVAQMDADELERAITHLRSLV